eukprot:scaffold50_cov420-Prasinococcus_capsulatus_cf.AAC.4
MCSPACAQRRIRSARAGTTEHAEGDYRVQGQYVLECPSTLRGLRKLLLANRPELQKWSLARTPTRPATMYHQLCFGIFPIQEGFRSREYCLSECADVCFLSLKNQENGTK